MKNRRTVEGTGKSRSELQQIFPKIGDRTANSLLKCSAKNVRQPEDHRYYAGKNLEAIVLGGYASNIFFVYDVGKIIVGKRVLSNAFPVERIF